MSEQIKDGGPAFSRPFSKDCARSPLEYAEAGMTLRQYAAIKLQVPESGDEWLDNMIRASLRNEFAAKVAPSIISECKGETRKPNECQTDYFARIAYEVADAMLAAREAKS